MSKSIFHFAFCFDENYAQYAAVCIRSILLHNSESKIIIHILSDGLSEKALQRLYSSTNSFQCELQFHYIDNSNLKNLPLNIWPIQAWYRILLPELLSFDIEKVLYLDCDTLVLSDLSELFAIDLSEYAFAAVEDPQSFFDETYTRCKYPKDLKYLCSGIMLFNLNYWRKNVIKEELIQYALENKNIIKYPDQDCLNAVCKNSKLILPLRFGVMDAFFKDERVLRSIPNNFLLDCIKNPAIIHFAGCAPWLKELRPSMFSLEWDKVNRTLKYKAKTKYICRGLRFVKMVCYKILHPIKTYRKRVGLLTIEKAQRLIDSKSNN